jgi:hypothetical protein
MKDNQVGTVDAISFRTTRKDPVYKYPIEGALTGTSISHCALRFIFNNKELFDKYIAGNPNIPYDDNLRDPVTGEPLFKVYFSFWPDSANITLQTSNSKLFPYEHDCEDAAMLTPASYKNHLSKVAAPETEVVSPSVPILDYLLQHTIVLPPPIALNKTKLKDTVMAAMQGQSQSDVAAKIADLLATAEQYSKLYDAMFDAKVAQQNASESIWTTRTQTKKLAENTALATSKLAQCNNKFKADIKEVLFPGQKISESTFLDAIETFMTIGLPEDESISLPLVLKSSTGKNYGLELEPMLQMIKDIADHPAKYKYNLFYRNCADAMMDVLNKGATSCADRKLKHAFLLPWYSRILGLPVSPAMVMQLSYKAITIEGMMRAEPIVATSKFVDIERDTVAVTTPRRKASYVLAPAAPVLQFSARSNSDCDETQRLALNNKPAFLCKLG